jgi:hypothetical protein
MPVFEIAFIVRGHHTPLRGLDSVKIDNDEDVGALRAAIVSSEGYSGRRADVRLWKVCSVNNIRARLRLTFHVAQHPSGCGINDLVRGFYNQLSTVAEAMVATRRLTHYFSEPPKSDHRHITIEFPTVCYPSSSYLVPAHCSGIASGSN